MNEALRRPIVQVAYHVANVEEAVARYARLFGIGPFYLAAHIPITRCWHRGIERPFDHSSAYAQSGDIMIELMTQHNDGPSVCRDLYGPTEEGIHHMAVFARSLPEDIEAFKRKGIELAHYAELGAGFAFAMVDTTRTLGHFVELYEFTEPLQQLYARIRESARGFDGTRLLRPMAELYA